MAVSDVDPEKKKTCCGPICWALFGCLGLIGLVLGLLFGLGVIGGNADLDINGPNVDINGPNANLDL